MIKKLISWNVRLEHLFEEDPIPFSRQGSDVYQVNTLVSHLAQDAIGLGIPHR
ncbi:MULTISPECIES: hypothetical protein [Vibrio]|uniref:hypothetical protein n=1 Tax=Vibrio TaxID=662 RepID=UPI001581CE3D|nr:MULTISPECIES: hypothetical protein [Vibrio]EJL6517661.1 hypothetical protein [Vibrio cholerae]EJL6992308.1 hypothetical protein [Vibrio cholerae]EJL8329449.1 hypothetical protein [Vibrio cholerae]QKU97317.1 hypothetical protein HPY14_11380 [Vibrio cholerae]